MKLKTMIVFTILLCFFVFQVFSITASAQPTQVPDSVNTLPEVTLPPPPQIPGSVPQKMEDGSIVIPKDQIYQPPQSGIDVKNGNTNIDIQDIDIESIKPPPIPKELLESQTPPAGSEIDINEPPQPIELPNANEKPWFFSWWFISLMILFIGGVVVILFQKTSSSNQKENSMFSKPSKK
jgi:cell division protein FtsN